jgi:hypothetical protein
MRNLWWLWPVAASYWRAQLPGSCHRLIFFITIIRIFLGDCCIFIVQELTASIVKQCFYWSAAHSIYSSS